MAAVRGARKYGVPLSAGGGGLCDVDASVDARRAALSESQCARGRIGGANATPRADDVIA